MTKHQKDGKPAFAVIPWEEYRALSPDAATDEELLESARAATDEETFPADVVNALLDGGNPVSVYRKYRRLKLAELARLVGVSPMYVSQIERGERTGSTGLLSKIADALAVDLDMIVP